MKEYKSMLHYLAGSFGIAWLVWAIALSGKLPASSAQWLTTIGMFAPLLSTVMLKRSCPEANVGFRLNLNFKRGWMFYAVALWGPALITFAGVAVYFAVFRNYDANMGYMETSVIAMYGEEAYQAQGGLAIIKAMAKLQIIQAVTVAPFFNAISGFGEEAGWRGWLYPTLCSRLGAAKGMVAGGVIWGLWHLPLTVSGHNYGTDYLGWPVLGVVAMMIFCTSAGACLYWLSLRCKSILPSALAHGAINAIAAVGNYWLPSDGANFLYGPNPAGLVAGLPLLVLGILAMWDITRMEKTPMAL